MEEKKVYTESERNWAMFCHLSALSGSYVPFGGIVVPLILWLSKKEDSSWIDRNGKASLNFQISLFLYMVLAFPLCFIIIGIPIMIFLAVFEIICIIFACVRAARGEEYKYPLSIPFIQ